MKKKPIHVALLFGGKSAEHEVSIQSAKNVYNALIEKKYEVSLIGIDKQGKWSSMPKQYLLETSTQLHALEVPIGKKVSSVVTRRSRTKFGMTELLPEVGESIESVDVVFPVLHGPYGEDGSMQGMLQIANLPYVGSGVLGSAVGMDKDVSKRLLRAAGLPVSDFLVFRRSDVILNDSEGSKKDSSPLAQNDGKFSFKSIVKQLGLPFFVKPANLGSSIGVAKVTDKKEFDQAVKDAFLYDTKVIIEEYIEGREIECAVLGNAHPKASLPGEVVLQKGFYDYDAKYIDEDTAALQIPADLPKEKIKEIQDLAIETFKVLCLDGMARIDFFLSKQNTFYINEANTIPGFTNISMYPKLWEATGIPYADLVEELINLAIEKNTEQRKLKTSR